MNERKTQMIMSKQPENQHTNAHNTATLDLAVCGSNTAY